MALQEKDEWQEIFLASRQSMYLVGTSGPIVCRHCLQKQLDLFGIQSSLEFPSPDCSRLRFVRAHALYSESFVLCRTEFTCSAYLCLQGLAGSTVLPFCISVYCYVI